MPSEHRQLGLEDARDLIRKIGFPSPASGSAGGLFGVELESFAVPARAPASLELPALPNKSTITFEPGGQVELSSRPARTVGEVCEAVATDLAVLREALARQGVDLIQQGMAPGATRRVVDGPRYRAMETYFDASGPAGRTMMCGTASVQVNADLGQGPDRWRRANAIGPALAAAFSTSESGCARLRTWLAVDPSRTAPVDGLRPGRDGSRPPSGSDQSVGSRDDADPAAIWAEYALDARVMLIRDDPDDYTPVLSGLTVRDWLTRGHQLGWPTPDDLAYHLTTLFPPVRPRGWLELRMIDALPDPWWRVPVAVVAAVLDDPNIEATASPARDARPTGGGRSPDGVRHPERAWRAAAIRGLGDPTLAAGAAASARATLAGLGRVGADPLTAGLVEQWAAAVLSGTAPPWRSLPRKAPAWI